ncbi:MAG: hypothetical protein Q9219_005309 [cf. Caloplaca sp. 3 TL-2023]
MAPSPEISARNCSNAFLSALNHDELDVETERIIFLDFLDQYLHRHESFDDPASIQRTRLDSLEEAWRSRDQHIDEKDGGSTRDRDNDAGAGRHGRGEEQEQKRGQRAAQRGAEQAVRRTTRQAARAVAGRVSRVEVPQAAFEEAQPATYEELQQENPEAIQPAENAGARDGEISPTLSPEPSQPDSGQTPSQAAADQTNLSNPSATVEDDGLEDDSDRQPDGARSDNSMEAEVMIGEDNGAANTNEATHPTDGEEPRQEERGSNAEMTQGPPLPIHNNGTISNADDPTPASPPDQTLETELFQRVSHTPLRLGAAANENHLRETVKEILQLPAARAEADPNRHPLETLGRLVSFIDSFFTPKAYLELKRTMKQIVKRQGFSTVFLDGEGRFAEGYTVSGKSLRRGGRTPPEALVCLQSQCQRARQMQVERVKDWGKTRWVITAMHCHFYWKDMKAILKGANTASNSPTPDEQFVLDMVGQSMDQDRTRGITAVHHLKLAVFPYLGLGPGDERFWKFLIRTGKAASVFRDHWGLLALTSKTTLHQLGYSLLKAAMPVVLSRHPTLGVISQILSKSYIEPLRGNGRLDRNLLSNFLRVADDPASLVEACRQRGLAHLFGFILEGQDSTSPTPASNSHDTEVQSGTPAQQQPRPNDLPTPPDTRHSRLRSGIGQDSEDEDTSSPSYDEALPPPSTQRIPLARPYQRTSDVDDSSASDRASPLRRVRRRTGG